jgi:hypothetical protein
MDNIKRKRGRPRKIVDEPIKDIKKEEDDNIILYLAFNKKNRNNADKKLNKTNKSEINMQSDNIVDDDTEIMENRFEDNDTSSIDSEQIDNDYRISQKKTQKISEKAKKNNDISGLIMDIQKKDETIMTLKKKLSSMKIAKENLNLTKKSKISYHCTQVKKLNETKNFTPKNTDIHCWWCDYPFDNLPVYLPSSYSDGTFNVFGNFCSFNCAMRYNNERCSDYKCKARNSLLHNMKYKMTGFNTPIKPADDRELLQSKGGPLSITKYRSNFEVPSLNIKLDMPPVIPLVHTITKSITEKLY